MIMKKYGKLLLTDEVSQHVIFNLKYKKLPLNYSCHLFLSEELRKMCHYWKNSKIYDT